MRNPSSAAAYTELQTAYPETLLTAKLDVSNEQEIKEVFEQAKTKFGRIDVVFNNAGFTLVGQLEGTPIEEGRRLFEVTHITCPEHYLPTITHGVTAVLYRQTSGVH